MTLNEYVNSIKDKRIAVIGVGVSNTPLINLLLSCGCNVTVCDKRSLSEMGMEALDLINRGAKLKLGEDYLEGLDHDIIFRTPGLMPFDPHLEAAKARGSLITSEMEVFFALCPCKTIAVTGSDGKTTTTTIISELLKAAAGGQHGVKLRDDLLDVGNAGGGGVELSQGAVGALRDNAGHGGLAGAGGAVEDHVGDLPALHNAAQHPVPAQNMALAHHIVQGFGSYLVCQRLVHGPPSVQIQNRFIISRRDRKVKPSGSTSFSCGKQQQACPKKQKPPQTGHIAAGCGVFYR